MQDVVSIMSDESLSPIQSIDTPVLDASNASSESGIIISDDYERATSVNSFSHRDIDTPDQSTTADESDPEKLANQLLAGFCQKLEILVVSFCKLYFN